MSFDAHANFAYATVDTPPTPAASGTSLTVATGLGSLFPAAPFNAVIYPNGTVPLASNAEIVRVTLVVGDVFTITRQEEGTNARTILAGDQIAAAITVRTLTDVETAIPSIAGLLSAINVSAGATSNNLSALTFDNSNGVTTDVAHMFLATGLEPGAAAPDPAEQVLLIWLPFDQAVDRVLNGSITESVSVAAILKVELLLRRDALPVG